MDRHRPLITRRFLSPEKLRQARIAAGYNNITEVARLVGVLRLSYARWEHPIDEKNPVLQSVDYVGLENALRLFGVSYEDVTDYMPPREQLPRKRPSRAKVSSLRSSV